MNELLRPDDTRDALRKLGGLLLGLGVLMLMLRKDLIVHEVGDLLALLLFAIPAAVLYGGGVLTEKATGRLRAWQTVYAIFGLVFVTLALFQLVDLIDEGSSGKSLNVFWIFAVVAALGFYAGATRGIRFGFLAGGIAAIVSWSALWDKLLGSEGIGGHIGVYRGLLGFLAIALLAGAVYLWRTNPGGDATGDTATEPGGELGLWKASELLTAAGLSAVLACSFGVTSVATLNPLATTITPIDTSLFWDVLLLVISLGLVGIGSQLGLRGPVYVGAIGLTLFLVIAGLDLDSEVPDPTKVGIWPIVLLVLGGLGILLSGVKEASLGDRPKQLVEQLRARKLGSTTTRFSREGSDE